MAHDDLLGQSYLDTPTLESPVDDKAPLRVLLADDHPLFLRGLRDLLEVDDIEVVAQAATGSEAVELVTKHDPDVVVLDIQMPGIDGVEATRAILDRRPKTGILMLTMDEAEGTVFKAIRAGARGYLVKDSNPEGVASAVRAVARGQVMFDEKIARSILTFFDAHPQATREQFPDLTDREREILGLIARGRKNAQIASELVLSPKTVRNHVSSILSKLQVADRYEAAQRARDAGLASE
jgi:DNA-binding NarL/FixJ family response regulator